VEALQKVTSGDAPIFVKGRQENPESSIVEIMLFFAVGLFGCETYIAAVVLWMGNKRDLVSFLCLEEKDGSPQCPMHVQYSWHLPYDDRCSQRPLQASGRRGPGNLLWHF